MSVGAREIALGGLLFLLLLSLGAHLWQLGGYQALSQAYGTLNASYVADQQRWTQARGEMEGQISGLQTRVRGLEADLSLRGQQLEDKQYRLDEETRLRISREQELADLRNQSSRQQAQLEEQRRALANLTGEFDTLQNSLNASMAWFQDNADLPGERIWNAKNLADRAVDDCVDGNVLNLACINYVLERTATITYRTDVDNQSRLTDHLQSVEETFRLGGGDCEDYSLLLKAILNSLRERGNYSLLAWTPGGAGRFRVYPKASLGEDVEKYWYYANAQGRPMGSLDGRAVWVVCFPLPSGDGHCTVAVGGEAPGEDARPRLDGAQVFEPQNGAYLGEIGAQFAVCRPEVQSDCWSRPYAIILVVGDRDLYKAENGHWIGYQNLYQRIEQEKPAAG